MAPKHEFVTCPACGTKIPVPAPETGHTAAVARDDHARTQWLAGPDRDMNWYQACQWIKNLTPSDWRMPTVDELEALDIGRCPGLDTSGWWIWSGEPDGPLSAMGLDVTLGHVYSGGRELDSGGRVFAVRCTGRKGGR